jgi:hypothetical protein
MPKRPIAHLENQHVFAKGIVDTWRHEVEDVAILIKHITLTDYDTDKIVLAPILDHCWIWAQDIAWEVQYDEHLTYKDHFTRLDEIHWVCRVEGYTRANGTRDYGLRLVSWFPVSTAQRAELRRNNARQAREYKRGKLNPRGKFANIENLCCQVFSLTLLDLKMEDWRCYSNSLRNARSQIKQNIAHIKAYLNPIYGKASVQAEIDSYMHKRAVQDIETLLKRPVEWDAAPSPPVTAEALLQLKPKGLKLPEDMPTDERQMGPAATFWMRVLKDPKHRDTPFRPAITLDSPS